MSTGRSEEIQSEIQALCREHYDLVGYPPFIVKALGEGLFDPGILRAVILAGGPAAGKSWVASKMFSGTGLKVVNSDHAFEFLMRKNNLDPKTDVGSPRAQEIRPQAKSLTAKQLELYVQGRLGIIVDGTAREVTRTQKAKENLEAAGYDVSMVFVNTALDVALDANRRRSRVVPEEIVRKSWKDAQDNRKRYKSMFGSRMFVVDNSKRLSDQEQIREFTPKVTRLALKIMQRPLQNPVGKEWLDREAAKYKKGQPLPRVDVKGEATAMLSRYTTDQIRTAAKAIQKAYGLGRPPDPPSVRAELDGMKRMGPGKWGKERKAIAKALSGAGIFEVSPSGFAGTVKAMKKHRDIENPYALAWAMKKRGAKPHYKSTAPFTKKKGEAMAETTREMVNYPLPAKRESVAQVAGSFAEDRLVLVNGSPYRFVGETEKGRYVLRDPIGRETILRHGTDTGRWNLQRGGKLLARGGPDSFPLTHAEDPQEATESVLRLPKTLGYKREQMPQIEDLDAFLGFLDRQGISHARGLAPVGELKAAQEEIDPEKALEMAENPEAMGKPVVVSVDGYVVDGSHRWAAGFSKGEGTKIPAVRVDLPVLELLRAARDWGQAGTKMNGESATQFCNEDFLWESAHQKESGALTEVTKVVRSALSRSGLSAEVVKPEGPSREIDIGFPGDFDGDARAAVREATKSLKIEGKPVWKAFDGRVTPYLEDNRWRIRLTVSA